MGGKGRVEREMEGGKGSGEENMRDKEVQVGGKRMKYLDRGNHYKISKNPGTRKITKNTQG